MSYYSEQNPNPAMASPYHMNMPPPQPQPYYPPPMQQQQQFTVTQNPPIHKIRDWIVWSIINIFLGWFLLGIIALIFSILCRSRKQSNNYEDARAMSTIALICNIVATVLGLLSWIGFIIWLVFYIRLVKEISN